MEGRQKRKKKTEKRCVRVQTYTEFHFKVLQGNFYKSKSDFKGFKIKQFLKKDQDFENYLLLDSTFKKGSGS